MLKCNRLSEFTLDDNGGAEIGSWGRCWPTYNTNAALVCFTIVIVVIIIIIISTFIIIIIIVIALGLLSVVRS